MRLLAMCVLVSLLAACGGDSASEPSKEPLPQDDVARSILLTVDDFPSGWSEKPQSEESSFDECSEYDDRAAGLVGRAETGDFSRGGAAELTEWVGIFDTEDAARDALSVDEEKARCLVDAINDGKLDDDEAEFSDASFSPLSFPDRGDAHVAYRFELRVQRKGESGFGSGGTIYSCLRWLR